jgi:hypothetical protein
MDPTRFDSLTRLIADSRSRRGLLGGALGVLAGLLAAPESEAKRKRHTAKSAKKQKKKSKPNAGTKRIICHCPPGNPQNCQTITVGAKAAKVHLKKHKNDLRGECPPPLCEGTCDDQQTCTALGESCVCRTLESVCGACIADGESAGGVAECCSDTYCAREGICGECPPLVCEGPCDNQATCTPLGEECVCRTLEAVCGACIQDGQTAGGANECCSEIFCAREGICGACPPQTCPGGPCTATSCGTGCTCVSLGGGTTACAALGTCPAGNCTAGSCGAGCTCVSPGAANSRCVSTASCPAGNCTPGTCGESCVCLGTGLGSRCIATVG